MARKLKTYVAEMNGFTPSGGGMPARETWTVQAPSKREAKKLLLRASGHDPVVVALAPRFPTRHWRAG
jgi:hypothetical protein